MRITLWILYCFLLTNSSFAQKPGNEKVIIIPVVVHVVYNQSHQNISNEQIRSQIAVLNSDYRKKNADNRNIPTSFRALSADARIEFRLASIDPYGMATEGIIRKKTSVPAFDLNDKIKSAIDGGSDGWNRDQYLNIWVGNLASGILGYASSPGCTPAKDGVVIQYDVFGTTGNVRAPYNKGRTTVHEIGHWLGLKHIWGDEPCGDDGIDDTPPQEGPTRGCPSGVVSSCSSGAAGNMYMNFMDFTNDDCVNMFTIGQVNKMHELFVEGGERSALLLSDKAPTDQNSTTTKNPVVAIYPNPAINTITIQFESKDFSGKEIVIYNHLGQVIKKMSTHQSKLVITISDLKDGMYFISTGDQKTYKFVKKS